ncbi:type II toxin-antitoxin system VapC family toxin [Leptolyngbya iicbica]|uniref:Type II toxin-antitoxin system VapC family toxin n=2 Tax=Cyanophyceae TaxID=3028117 RepID=A0A4Q7EG19_9CYAN|nr:type II toxin-antitoxin system VapC family toxin [Leptolyngbya sp. LK]RZM81898.1 type II toxin-antitoxin system VapC family toxin [Leptolyngbya sp. LK]
MIAVDTNVLVRLLTQDDADQYERSVKLFQSPDTIFIPTTVILETAWVLRTLYDFQPKAICTALRKVLGLPNVRVDNGSQLALALRWHETGLDFADALHLAQCQSCETLYTFDQRFVKWAVDLKQCDVRVTLPE